MAIGKSSISDMDFESFKETMGNSLALDEASKQYERQKNDFDKARVSLGNVTQKIVEARAELNRTVNELLVVSNTAIRSVQEVKEIIGKIEGTTIHAKVEAKDWDRLIDYSRKIVSAEEQFLETHRAKTREDLAHHFYAMSNEISKNKGVWLSDKWCRVLLWIFIPCLIYTLVSVVLLIVSYFEA